MAKQLLVLEEVLAMLKVTGAPNRVIEKFREHWDQVFAHKPQTEIDDVQVASGYGERPRRGMVELTVNDQRIQMEPKKAQEIALMLLESAEAAVSDEVFMRFLEDKFKIPDDDQLRGHILLDLREIRQGTRGVSRPT